MKNTTLCYIKQNDKYLMLHRTKKSDDPNEGKWIGIGGHMEDGESPEECVYDGRLIDECNEGELQWVPVDQIMNLPMWEGDKLFLPCIMDESNGFFSMKLVYEGDRLVKHTLYEY